MIRGPPRSTLFPNTRLFRSRVRPHVPRLVPCMVSCTVRSVNTFYHFKGGGAAAPPAGHTVDTGRTQCNRVISEADRKSTRLNSSHANISYAVFCLKKKKSYN